jgi:hypothetical protein
VITVARKAFEKFRKTHEKDESGLPEEPLEVEILVDEYGEIVVQEEDEKERRQREDQATADHAIDVDLTEAVENLLATMADSTDQQWDHAHLTITPREVEATFDYPENHTQPIVVDINLPNLPKPDALDFDPAFDLRPLGPNFAPGVHDPHGTFSPKERRIADRLEKEGWRIDARPADHGSGDKNPDAMVRKSAAERGVILEFKSPRSSASNTLKRNIDDAGDQAREIVIDGRNIGVTEADAWRAYRRAAGQPGKTIADVVHVILGDGRLVSYQKEQ